MVDILTKWENKSKLIYLRQNLGKIPGTRVYY
jgi:hypothetical protein